MSLRQNIGAFVPVQGVCQPLRRRTAIATLALESHDPINVEPADRRSIFQLLPPDERLWVRRADASLVQSIRLRRGDAPLLVVGPRRLGPGFTRQNQRFVSSIAAAASLAFQNLSQSGLSESPGGPPLTHEPQEVAAECTSCRRIQKWTVSACAYCGGALAHAVVPEILLGKFQVVERVGHGGMGIVYRGTDLVLGRSVAVKTLPRLSETAAMRLRREARTMASVTHPNLAVIFGAETWRGTPFLIVEFLEGGTLAARLDQGPLALDEALTVCATIAEVLASLHAAGILHRDIKPSNVGFSGAGQVKLLDFGLARLFTNHSDGSPGVPDARNAGPAASDNGRSMLVGTPLYMSPEAVHGHPAEPSFDLWSLGVVLYETLSGRPPFSGTSVAEVFAAIDSVDTADLRSPLRPCPHPVIEFACRMLARDRSLRPASATAVANELRRLTVDCCTQPAR